LGGPSAGGQAYPATSAYVTAIGGTSIGIPDGSAAGAEVGWGNSATILSFATNGVFDPPLSFGFQGGSGGGESTFITKPSWQKSFGGTGRHEPDISAVADPFTGVVFVEFGQAFAGIGGTSLSCPILSGIWAIADQKAGKSLGQAAPLIYKLPSGAVNDVLPLSSPTNPAGVIFDSAGSTFYSSDTLLAPLFGTTQYYSALWNLSGEYVDLSFGTDSTLTVTKGWDFVTGRGVPNGLSFINAAAAQ
jgi:subtilase family serine protease